MMSIRNGLHLGFVPASHLLLPYLPSFFRSHFVRFFSIPTTITLCNCNCNCPFSLYLPLSFLVSSLNGSNNSRLVTSLYSTGRQGKSTHLASIIVVIILITTTITTIILITHPLKPADSFSHYLSSSGLIPIPVLASFQS